ncbi:MAG: PilZ domain-containing protein [Nitrospira sp.]|nr:PilZ domain-containing protein [Nitrospira sp.]
MAFALRRHSRFPIFSPVRYERGNRDGVGTVTNLFPLCWRVSGSLPLMPGDVCAFKVRLPTKQWISVAAGKVRWVRGEEYGIETLVMNTESQETLNTYLHERIKAL